MAGELAINGMRCWHPVKESEIGSSCATAGSVGVVVANAFDKPISAILELDPADLGWSDGPPIRRPIDLAGLDARLVELKPEPQ